MHPATTPQLTVRRISYDSEGPGVTPEPSLPSDGAGRRRRAGFPDGPATGRGHR